MFDSIPMKTLDVSDVKGEEISVKVSFRGENRMVTVPLDAKTIDALNDKCAEYFRIRKMGRLIFKYTDGEGDELTLTSVDELKSAKKLTIAMRRKFNNTVIEKNAQQLEQVEDPHIVAMSGLSLNKTNSCGANAQIVENKIVQLKWSLGDETGILGVKKNGKITFQHGNKINNLWCLKKSDKGDIYCSPVLFPARNLRIAPHTGEVGLNHGELGRWARFALAPASENAMSVETTKPDLCKLTAESSMQLVQGSNSIGIKTFERNNKTKKELTRIANTGSKAVIEIDTSIPYDDVILQLSTKLSRKMEKKWSQNIQVGPCKSICKRRAHSKPPMPLSFPPIPGQSIHPLGMPVTNFPPLPLLSSPFPKHVFRHPVHFPRCARRENANGNS